MDVSLILGVASVKKIIDAFRFLFDGDVVQIKSFLITVGSWALGVGIVALVAESSLAGDLGLVDLNLADLILAGVGVGSGAGVISDYVSPQKNLVQ